MQGYSPEPATPPAFAHQGDRLLYKPEESAELLAISRAKLFELLASGEIESFKIGASRRIPAGALDEYVERKRSGAGAA